MDFLNKHAEKLGERVCEDIYFDFADLRLITNDIWLRKRNGRYELKFPMTVEGKKSDVYEEIEDEARILTKLDLKNFDSLTQLVTLVTRRQKFQIDDALWAMNLIIYDDAELWLQDSDSAHLR